MTVVSTTSTTIRLSWTSSGPEVDSYEIMWERDTSGECSEEHINITTINNVSTSYNFTIKGLEEDSSYIITVKETNAAGSAVGDPVIATTLEAGEVLMEIYE